MNEEQLCGKGTPHDHPGYTLWEDRPARPVQELPNLQSLSQMKVTEQKLLIGAHALVLRAAHTAQLCERRPLAQQPVCP